MGNIIAWIVLGLVAGAIAKLIYPGRQGGGILATMVLGIVGAFLGGAIFTLLTTGKLVLAATNAFNIPSIFVAVVGALVAIWLWNLINRTA
ncbi:GlsB/YeaQ/YmgE family stress response membrane protein [Aerosakkonema sp. BLCC-F183]|uniref:GlsB/YeaQ/YmgE family stress response membrane protein n=1 Tax=Aerosakkonema sp. BLCC-F183 TaxID=3342834 RepID=UPI0035B8BD0F